MARQVVRRELAAALALSLSLSRSLPLVCFQLRSVVRSLQAPRPHVGRARWRGHRYLECQGRLHAARRHLPGAGRSRLPHHQVVRCCAGAVLSLSHARRSLTLVLVHVASLMASRPPSTTVPALSRPSRSSLPSSKSASARASCLLIWLSYALSKPRNYTTTMTLASLALWNRVQEEGLRYCKVNYYTIGEGRREAGRQSSESNVCLVAGWLGV